LKKSFYFLCLILLLFPFHKVLGSYEVFNITFNPYSFGMICLSLVAVFNNVLRNQRYGLNLIDIFIILLCLTFLCSTILSKDLIGTGRLAYTAIFIPVLSYFNIKSFIKSEKDYKLALAFFIAGIVLFAAVAPFLHGYKISRGTILLQHPIGIATLSVFAICSLFYSRLWRKKIGLIAFIMSSCLMLISLSRAYFAGLLVSPLLFKIFRRGNSLIVFLSFYAISLILILLLSFSSEHLKTKEVGLEERNTVERLINIDLWKYSLYKRSLSYQEGLNNFMKNYMFGTGLQITELIMTRHCFHIELLEYSGLIGYLLFFLLFYSYYAIHKDLAKVDLFCAAHLLIVILILLNSSTNGILHGVMPVVTFVTMGFAEARRKVIDYNELQ